MPKKTSVDFGDQQKPLIEWAEGTFFESRGQVSRFISFIKLQGKEPMEVVSHADFLVLKTKFEE